MHQGAGGQRNAPHQEFVELGLQPLDSARQVEGVDATVVAELPKIVQPPHDALGHAGRAAGVEQPQVVSTARPGRLVDQRIAGTGVRRRRLLVRNRPLRTGSRTVVDPQPGVNRLHPGPQSLDPRGETAVEDDRRDVRVVPEIEQFALDVAVVRVDRHQGGLEAGQRRLHVLGHVVEVLRHLVLALDAALDQRRRHAVRAPMHLGLRAAAARRAAQGIKEHLRRGLRPVAGDRFQNVRVMPVAHGRWNLAVRAAGRHEVPEQGADC